MAASIMKTIKLDTIPSVTNIGASGGVELIRWGYVENAIIIITSSVPCIRPLIISSVRKFSSRAYSRSYELTGGQSGQRRTGNRDMSNSNIHRARSGRFTKSQTNNNDDTDSVERILDHASHHNVSTTTTVSRRQDSPTHDDRGITKFVEISVMADDHFDRRNP